MRSVLNRFGPWRAASSSSPRTEPLVVEESEPREPSPGVAPPEDLATRRALVRLRRLGWYMDAAWRVPGTRFRVGYDALVGLVPGVGDLVGAGLSIYLIAEAARLGAGRKTLARMAGNAAVETVVGAVPVAGDLFDAGFKANLRNVRLLERELAGRSEERAARGAVA